MVQLITVRSTRGKALWFSIVILHLGLFQQFGTLPSRSRSTMVFVNQSTPDDAKGARSTTNHRFAYSFVIGGCNPDEPSRYRGYVYNILVATRMLRNLGSTADVVAFFQISSRVKNATRVLPYADLRPLEALGVKVRYIPPSPTESFYETNMNKFQILGMTEYDRIIFMDGDVLPLTNLDYLFDLSMQGVLKKNMVIAAPLSPANGGFFMLTPEPGDLELVQEIIRERERKPFDPVQGYGHAIVPPDKWATRRNEGTRFDFYGGNADQGLLYHWVKYVKKEVSIIFATYVENYMEAPNSAVPVLEQSLTNKPLDKYHPKALVVEADSCRKFMCDFRHFTGEGKPWLTPKLVTTPTSSLEWWWYIMQAVNRDLEMGLHFDEWDMGMPILGVFSPDTEKEVAQRNTFLQQ